MNKTDYKYYDLFLKLHNITSVLVGTGFTYYCQIIDNDFLFLSTYVKSNGSL